MTTRGTTPPQKINVQITSSFAVWRNSSSIERTCPNPPPGRRSGRGAFASGACLAPYGQVWKVAVSCTGSAAWPSGWVNCLTPPEPVSVTVTVKSTLVVAA